MTINIANGTSIRIQINLILTKGNLRKISWISKIVSYRGLDLRGKSSKGRSSSHSEVKKSMHKL